MERIIPVCLCLLLLSVPSWVTAGSTPTVNRFYSAPPSTARPTFSKDYSPRSRTESTRLTTTTSAPLI
uniref:Putative secreted protein n=1 Tax=Anopheles darlingi TaxID=43151 RepID=A0A2M4DGW9_ANODA